MKFKLSAERTDYLTSLSRGFDIGMTYGGIKRGVGIYRNPGAEFLFKKYGYFETFLIQSAITVLLFAGLYFYLLKVNSVGLYFLLLYGFTLFGFLAGFRWVISILKDLL